MQFILFWTGKSLMDEPLGTWNDLESLILWQKSWKQRQTGMTTFLDDSQFYVVVTDGPGSNPHHRLSLAEAKLMTAIEGYSAGTSSSGSRGKALTNEQIMKALPQGQRLVSRSEVTRNSLETLERLEDSVTSAKARFERAIETICKAMAEAE